VAKRRRARASYSGGEKLSDVVRHIALHVEILRRGPTFYRSGGPTTVVTIENTAIVIAAAVIAWKLRRQRRDYRDFASDYGGRNPEHRYRETIATIAAPWRTAP